MIVPAQPPVRNASPGSQPVASSSFEHGLSILTAQNSPRQNSLGKLHCGGR